MGKEIISNLESEIGQLESEQAKLPEVDNEKKLILERGELEAKMAELDEQSGGYRTKIMRYELSLADIKKELQDRTAAGTLTQKSHKHGQIQKSIDGIEQRIAEFAELRCDAC